MILIVVIVILTVVAIIVVIFVIIIIIVAKMSYFCPNRDLLSVLSYRRNVTTFKPSVRKWRQKLSFVQQGPLEIIDHKPSYSVLNAGCAIGTFVSYLYVMAVSSCFFQQTYTPRKTLHVKSPFLHVVVWLYSAVMLVHWKVSYSISLMYFMALKGSSL